MCEPATIGLALSIASAGAGYLQSVQETNEKNARISAENMAKTESDLQARIAANQEREDLENQARVESERILEDEYENQLAGRATAAELKTQASSYGLNMAGSVTEAWNELNAAGFRSELTATQEMKQVQQQLATNKRGVKAKERRRIEENRLLPYRSGPSPLGAALEIGGSVNTYAEKKGGYGKAFGID